MLALAMSLSGAQDIPVVADNHILVQDRTGILASLILICCNASEEEIISDYAR